MNSNIITPKFQCGTVVQVSNQHDSIPSPQASLPQEGTKFYGMFYNNNNSLATIHQEEENIEDTVE